MESKYAFLLEKSELHSVTVGATGAIDMMFSQVLHSSFSQPFFNDKRRLIKTKNDIRI